MSATVVVGDCELVRATCIELARAGVTATPLDGAEADVELPQMLDGAARVIIATRTDALALRLVLLVRDRASDIDLVVTVFDGTLAAELREPGLDCRVVASAEVVAASVAGPCAGDADALSRTEDGVEDLDGLDALVRRAHRERRAPLLARPWRSLASVARPHDTSARILVGGLAGLALMLAIDVVIGLTALDEEPIEALFYATRILTTVSGNDALLESSATIRLISVLTMLGTLASIALFSAGLVSRLVEPRHVGIVGRRSMPRRDHVVVIGMGQIGLRTALLLRDAGIRVVGVDRDPAAVGVRLGKISGLPIVIADAEDRALLRRVGAARARAIAAVTSDDLVNIEVAMAARAVRGDATVVMRAGDGEIARETRSLLHLGVVRDAHRLVAIALCVAALRDVPCAVLLEGGADRGWVVLESGESLRWPAGRGTAAATDSAPDAGPGGGPAPR